MPPAPIFDLVNETVITATVQERGTRENIAKTGAGRRAALAIGRLAAAAFSAVLLAGAAVPASQPVLAADDPVQQLARLNEQLAQDHAQVEELNHRVQKAQADLDAINRKLAEDQQRESQLNQQIAELARSRYQRPAVSLGQVLNSDGPDDVLTRDAEARLIADKQHDMLAQAEELQRQDEQARADQARTLAEIQTAREQAAQVAARTLALRDAANDAVLKARAQSLVDQAAAAQSAAALPVSLQGEAPVSNHFPAGWCTYYVASRRNVPWWGDAIDWWTNARAYGYAEGQAPAVGAIMVTRESVQYGHVAFVESVNPDGSWTVSEMNYVAWNVQSKRTIRPGQVPVVGFIYAKQ